jgi:predicted RNase H-like nuclease (RuvC/YqgF family)
MEKQLIFNSDLHFEHNQWRSELAFWEDELKSFKNRLEELVNRWTDKEVLAQLEHFQNSFIRHGEVIDILHHDINAHETNMSSLDTKGENALNKDLVKTHLEFRNRMETQRHIYANLKKDFFQYLSKYM